MNDAEPAIAVSITSQVIFCWVRNRLKNCSLPLAQYFVLIQKTLFIFIFLQERIELTVTKTCMDVIRTLSNSFNNAVSLKCISNTGVLSEIGFSCYKLINDFGVDVILCLKPDQPFRVIF